ENTSCCRFQSTKSKYDSPALRIRLDSWWAVRILSTSSRYGRGRRRMGFNALNTIVFAAIPTPIDTNVTDGNAGLFFISLAAYTTFFQNRFIAAHPISPATQQSRAALHPQRRPAADGGPTSA